MNDLSNNTVTFKFDMSTIMVEAHAAARNLVARALASHNRETEMEIGRATRGGYKPNLRDWRIPYAKALSMTLKSAWYRAHACKLGAMQQARHDALPVEKKNRIADLHRQVRDLDYRAIRTDISPMRRSLNQQIALLEAA